jgi:hypothetical protein
MMGSFFILILVVLGLMFYFIPTMIASLRVSSKYWTVFWFNLLLGWTGIGWILAIVIAVFSQPKSFEAI